MSALATDIMLKRPVCKYFLVNWGPAGGINQMIFGLSLNYMLKYSFKYYCPRSIYFSIYFFKNKPSKNKPNVGFYSTDVTQLFRFIPNL